MKHRRNHVFVQVVSGDLIFIVPWKIKVKHLCHNGFLKFLALSWISRLCWCGPQYLLTVSHLHPALSCSFCTSPPAQNTTAITHRHTNTHRRRTENSINPQASSCLSSLDTVTLKLFQQPPNIEMSFLQLLFYLLKDSTCRLFIHSPTKTCEWFQSALINWMKKGYLGEKNSFSYLF